MGKCQSAWSRTSQAYNDPMLMLTSECPMAHSFMSQKIPGVKAGLSWNGHLTDEETKAW